MKKSAILLVALVLATAVLITGCSCNRQPSENPAPGTTTTTTTTTTTPTSAQQGEEDATTTTGTGSTTGKPGTTTTQRPADNVVNWEDYFGNDTTTTTTKKGDTTTTTKPTTTTTTKPTTTTTLKPTTIDKVSLPAVDSDVDGRGRIFLSEVALKKGVVTLTIKNRTDEQKTQWITEETNYVTYACYDKNGNELTGKGEMFGYLYLGSLEAGDEVSFKITLPEGTASLKLTGAKIVYWTPWS